jgi:aminoglycoside phosphotransferase family enzyme
LLSPDLNIEPVLVESVAAAQLSAWARLEQELMQRAQQKRIVEAHGDLRPEHICLSDPPCVIDSLEFSADLRTLDSGEELAFLGVECDRLGSAWVGKAVLQAYCAQSGDPITSELMDFYRSRRATVRAKLVAWHLRDPAVCGLANWRQDTREYLDLAHSYAMRVP